MRIRSFLRAVSASICALATVSAIAGGLTADQLVQIKRVGAPVLSPDGTQMVYGVRETDMDADKGRYDLWISSIDGGEPRRLTSHPANESSPAWSSDGKRIYFLSGRDDSSQVWQIPAAGGEPQQVTSLPLDVGTYKLAPAGDKLIVSLSVYLDCEDLACTAARNDAAEESPVSASQYDQLFMRHWDHWLDDTRSQLFVIALDESGLANGEPLQVTTIDADVPSRVWGGSEEYAVSPDGRSLFFAARLRDRDEPISTNFDVYSAPLNGDGDTQNLTIDNKAWDTQPVISPDGDSLVYLAMRRPGFEADKFDVVLRDLQSGKTHTLTSDWDRSVASVSFAADGRSLLLNAQDVGQKTLWRLSLDGGTPQRIIDRDTVSSFTSTAHQLVFVSENLAAPREIFVSDLDGANKRQITHFGEQGLNGVEMGEYEQFSFAGADGDRVYGFVVKPAGFEAGKKYPIAFLIHGGPQGSFSNDFHYRWNPQTYAGQGFAAVMIDFHGSTGYGQDFTDSISGDWGGKPLKDLQLGLAAAVDQYAFLDGDNACALGASYGGYMINWISGQWPDRFRCLVNHDGVFDSRSMYYTTEELWFPEWENGGPYFANPEGHEKYNPAQYVERWQTPMLVVHGELDYRVPVTQGIAAFTALQRRGIESRFLYFPDENHWVLKPHNSIHWHEQVNAWLHKYLDK